MSCILTIILWYCWSKIIYTINWIKVFYCLFFLFFDDLNLIILGPAPAHLMVRGAFQKLLLSTGSSLGTFFNVMGKFLGGECNLGCGTGYSIFQWRSCSDYFLNGRSHPPLPSHGYCLYHHEDTPLHRPVCYSLR